MLTQVIIIWFFFAVMVMMIWGAAFGLTAYALRRVAVGPTWLWAVAIATMVTAGSMFGAKKFLWDSTTTP